MALVRARAPPLRWVRGVPLYYGPCLAVAEAMTVAAAVAAEVVVVAAAA